MTTIATTATTIRTVRGFLFPPRGSIPGGTPLGSSVAATRSPPRSREGYGAYNAMRRLRKSIRGLSRQSSNQKRRDDQSNRRKQFYEDVKRRPCCVLEWIADCVSDDRGLVRRAPFAAQIAGLDEFLCVVPSAASRVPDEGRWE